MKAPLALEAIGDDSRQHLTLLGHIADAAYAGLGDAVIGRPPPQRQWCAEIAGRSRAGRYVMSFLRGKKDYRGANSKGSRGVMVWYTLDEGKIYAVSSPESWRRDRRYFARVCPDGTIEEVTREDVDLWLAQRATTGTGSGLTS